MRPLYRFSFLFIVSGFIGRSFFVLVIFSSEPKFDHHSCLTTVVPSQSMLILSPKRLERTLNSSQTLIAGSAQQLSHTISFQNIYATCTIDSADIEQTVGRIIKKKRMLHRLFQPPQSLSKSEKKTFIPFHNERDFRGALLAQSTSKPSDNAVSRKGRNIAMIQNLKKSSKEYFFDKKYQKMKSKLDRVERGLKAREQEYDYEKEVQKCLRLVDCNRDSQLSKQPRHNYYVDLKNELNTKLASFKDQIIDKLHQKKATNPQPKKTKTPLTKSATGFYSPPILQQSIVSPPNSQKQVNRQLFRGMGKRAELMADFSNQGLKYRHMVEGRRLDPWEKWYRKEEMELFPGETVIARHLKKSIY